MASTNPDETLEQGNVSYIPSAQLPETDMRTYAKQKPQNPEEIPSDVTAAVDELLNKLSNQFAEVSQEMFAKSESNLSLRT